MQRPASRIGRHLNYATVVSSITAFVVLAGGMAFAANQLAKNSVGNKQLKANAVTAAKIKKNAVTAAKIKAGAVNGKKVKGKSLGAADFHLAGMPYTHIVQELRTTANASVPNSMEPAVVPLPGASYTQEAGRTDVYLGTLDVTFHPGCTGKRAAIAYLLLDAPATTKLDSSILLSIIAVGIAEDNSSGQATKRLNLSTYAAFGTRFAPAAAQSHTFSLLLAGACESGSGITAAGPVAIDVVGTR
jgi:hypothetical protein